MDLSRFFKKEENFPQEGFQKEFSFPLTSDATLNQSRLTIIIMNSLCGCSIEGGCKE